jgi:hypothetical protein
LTADGVSGTVTLTLPSNMPGLATQISYMLLEVSETAVVGSRPIITGVASTYGVNGRSATATLRIRG